jgi:hypothetical protein
MPDMPEVRDDDEDDDDDDDDDARADVRRPGGRVARCR